MDELGCFSIEGDYSLRPFNVLPQSRSAVGTKFILYTHDADPQEFSPHEANSLSEQLVAEKSVIMVIHGWISSRENAGIQVCVNMYLYRSIKATSAEQYLRSISNAHKHRLMHLHDIENLYHIQIPPKNGMIFRYFEEISVKFI